MKTQADAKRFFAERVISQAEREGAALSEAERRMLYWSESDPEFTVEPELVEELAREISDAEYEAKIGRLLDAAYLREVQANPPIRDEYRRAYLLLEKGDHYILLMIDLSLAKRLRPWWKFSWA